jgi:hypothetical protein
MPGIGLEMDGAMQQAPQPERQFMGVAIKLLADGTRLTRAKALIVAQFHGRG